MPKLRITGDAGEITAAPGAVLSDVLRQAGYAPDSPCGGQGSCGKCKVLADGAEVLACKTRVERDMQITLPGKAVAQILQSGIETRAELDPVQAGYLLALDIGTTSVVCFLLDGKTGRELTGSSMQNPQAVYGADVISRIRAALDGAMEQLTRLIRDGVTALIQTVCAEAGISPEQIGVVSVVGNPAMQQLFLGISPKNLAAVPFAPVLTRAKTVPCGQVLPICPKAQLLVVPDISGYIGADTMGCVLSAQVYQKEEITLLVDIGTNGEMVLGNREGLIACSTAAGPALEGANIRFGMRGRTGAIDHVWLEEGKLRYSVIGGGEAQGICGSGLVDAVAVGLRTGLLNRRGRIQNEDHVFYLTKQIYLTQEDIRQVQLAKGAICAGIRMMAKQLGLQMGDIDKVYLAGAFGTFLDPESACRIGLLPEELRKKICPIGNAAGSGAKMLACDRKLLPLTQTLAEKIEFLELAGLPDFPGTFAKAMLFREETP